MPRFNRRGAQATFDWSGSVAWGSSNSAREFRVSTSDRRTGL